MAEWSVETCSPIISSNKCADMKSWLIVLQICIKRMHYMPVKLFQSPGNYVHVLYRVTL